MKLRGEVAVVTGGARGIGLAIARALGDQGARVAIAARSSDEVAAAGEELSRGGLEVLARPADVTREAEVRALIDDVLRAWGRVDVLVNNAGATGAIGRLDECDVDAWKSAVEVNLYGTMHGCRAVLPHMRSRRRGTIVNLAGGGVGGAGIAVRMSGYVASKAAVVQLTEALAREVAADGVRVNAVAPGAVVTAMTAGIVAAGADAAGKELYERTVEQRRSGGEPPELAARAVVWLASAESAPLTGKMLSAKWDDTAAMDVADAARSSLYTLRRIDRVMFAEVSRSSQKPEARKP
ncbi:MAG TPA: SDR family NAD(P)-dependent oxidoreductase [Polyangiaceae bacterium]|nr:SDR family NAD(P)-dependent oxidoreductase [Polyangiaceae bacterium]